MEPVQPASVPDSTVTAPALDAPVSSPDSTSAPTPSTALEQAVQTGDTRTYKQERHKQRQDALKGTNHAQNTPPKPAKQAASTDASRKPAASEPAAPAEKPKGHKRDQRVSELQSENAALEAELRRRADLRKQLASAETTPAPSIETKPAAPAATRPKPSEDEIGSKYQNYGEYVEDLTDWKAEQREHASQQSRAAEREQRELYTKAETFDSEIATFAERVQDWRAKNPSVQLEERLLAIPTASGLELYNATVDPNQRIPIGPEHFLVDEIRKSEIPGPMLAYFSDGREFKRLYDLTVRDSRAALRELGRIEAKLLGTASPTVSPAARVSAVPAPPTQLGKKPASGLDPLQKAIQAGDTRAYKALRHQQRIGTAL